MADELIRVRCHKCSVLFCISRDTYNIAKERRSIGCL